MKTKRRKSIYLSYVKTNSGNKKRLTGEHETASWKTFSSGVANRGASIRIPSQTYYKKSPQLHIHRLQTLK